ncbi:hypothetical protein C8J57DRAFT_1511788 [Mycena rebaudengoi]|nr:hypothetical protein C8J57DRAFT_1511788 [Mycena rebaudengoi]
MIPAPRQLLACVIISRRARCATPPPTFIIHLLESSRPSWPATVVPRRGASIHHFILHLPTCAAFLSKISHSPAIPPLTADSPHRPRFPTQDTDISQSLECPADVPRAVRLVYGVRLLDTVLPPPPSLAPTSPKPSRFFLCDSVFRRPHFKPNAPRYRA